MSIAIQENLKKQLQAKNMTAAELERRTGIPHAVVNIIHGRSKNPSIKTATAIAKELGCSLDELLHEGIKTKPVQLWNAQLYSEVCTVVLQQIHELHMQPTAEQVALWITDSYKYALGSSELIVDKRFVQWLMQRESA